MRHTALGTPDDADRLLIRKSQGGGAGGKRRRWIIYTHLFTITGSK